MTAAMPGPGVTGRLAPELWALLAIAQRDLIELLRDRPRLAVNLAFPILLVAGLGSVPPSKSLRASMTGLPGVPYSTNQASYDLHMIDLEVSARLATGPPAAAA